MRRRPGLKVEGRRGRSLTFWRATWKQLKRRIEGRSAKVGIVGLGYVGLPLAVEFAKAGFPVVGLDVDADRVGRVSRGLPDQDHPRTSERLNFLQPG